MTWTVYALRVHGENEPRYIGQTSREPFVRMITHLAHAFNSPANSFREWLTSNARVIEAVEVSQHDTLADAREAERAAIILSLAKGHRLFNHRMVPAAQRTPKAKVAA
jgi:hypothetical protein